MSCRCGGRSKKPFVEAGSLRDPESGQLLFRLSEGGIHDAETRGGKQRPRSASLFHDCSPVAADMFIKLASSCMDSSAVESMRNVTVTVNSMLWFCKRRDPSANGDDDVGYMSLVRLPDLERMLAAATQSGWL